MKSKTKSIGVRMPTKEYAVIERAIRQGRALNATDYARQAIREKITRDGERQ